MSYKVIKWIKGHPYLYSQRTYRVGNRVYTQSKYIGPASAKQVDGYSKRKGRGSGSGNSSKAKSQAHERIGNILGDGDKEVNTTKSDKKLKIKTKKQS